MPGQKLSLQQLQDIIKKGKIWNSAKDRNPRYPDGDNRSRTGFLYNPYFHDKGKLLQTLIKPAILASIDMIHKAIVMKYDQEAYIYDDPRLQTFNAYFRAYIKYNFRHTEYKTQFMNKVLDIILFLMKEDSYYRSRFFDMLNQVPKAELTQDELDNINEFH